MLTLNEIQMLKASLSLGFGLAKSAEQIFKTVRELSQLIREDETFKKMCEDSIKKHIAGHLNMGQKAMSDMNFDEFVKTNGYLTRFVPRLTLWEEFSTLNDTDERMFFKAVYKYRYPEEVAAACGMEMDEMWDFIGEHEKLSLFLDSIGFNN